MHRNSWLAVIVVLVVAGIPSFASAHYRQVGLSNNGLHHHGGLLDGLDPEASKAHLWVTDQGLSASYWGSKPCYDTDGQRISLGVAFLWQPTLDPDPALFGDSGTTECGPARTDPANPEGATGRGTLPPFRGLGGDNGGNIGRGNVADNTGLQTLVGMDVDALLNSLPFYDPDDNPSTPEGPWYSAFVLNVDPAEPFHIASGENLLGSCAPNEISLPLELGAVDVPCLGHAALNQDAGAPGRDGGELIWVDWAGGAPVDQDINVLQPQIVLTPGVATGTDFDVEVDDSIASFVYNIEAGVANPAGIPSGWGLGATNYTTMQRRDLVLQGDADVPSDLLAPKGYFICIDNDGDVCTNSAGLTGLNPSDDYAVTCRTKVGARAFTGVEVFWGSPIVFNDPDFPGAEEPCTFRTLVNADGNAIWASSNCKAPSHPEAYNRTTPQNIDGVLHPVNYALDCDFGLRRTVLGNAPDNTTSGANYSRLWDGQNPASVVNAAYPGGLNPPTLP
ncbi:MAG: hypothetical protein ACT4PT_09295, partial [Methanobacteriota archaeon]